MILADYTTGIATWLALGLIFAEIFRAWCKTREVDEGTAVAGYILLIPAWPAVLVATAVAAYIGRKT